MLPKPALFNYIPEIVSQSKKTVIFLYFILDKIFGISYFLYKLCNLRHLLSVESTWDTHSLFTANFDAVIVDNLKFLKKAIVNPNRAIRILCSLPKNRDLFVATILCLCAIFFSYLWCFFAFLSLFCVLPYLLCSFYTQLIS